MSSCSSNTYFQKINNAIHSFNGNQLSELLSFHDPHMMNPNILKYEALDECLENFIEPFRELVLLHLRCIMSIVNENNFIQAYEYQTSLVQAFIKLLQTQMDENWMLPIMYNLCLDLRILASHAESQSIKEGTPMHGVYLEKASDVLLGCFRVCAIDNFSSSDFSKKWGMLYLVNQLFKIYFKINRLPLCKPLIRAVENSKCLENYPLAQIVTYKFFVGRKAFYDIEYEKANRLLTFAYTHCHKSSQKNIRLILIYLIPVKIFLGCLPTHYVLAKYNLLQFEPIVKAVKEGNLGMLEKSKEENKRFFVRSGIYLFMDKLKMICLRNLFKRVFLILGSYQIDIASFLVALKFSGYEADHNEEEDSNMDEVECLLANLIYEEKIKGYISHQHRKLVVSKLNAFPKLIKKSEQQQ